MIPDRIIEQGTLTTDGEHAAVEVRIPWYRAIPASCISEVSLAVDGVPAPADSLTWTMNGETHPIAELAQRSDDWWFPLDSAVVTGALPVEPGGEHRVDVELKLYIPYIVIGDDEVLRIEEHDTKTMAASSAKEAVS
ncbi:C-glycoside deglycosidase beta subunit domain-containing protein [Amnibacterium sp.]|uniref:C-glycoside deglycosidase beta subunit domain-containing protein n=1 Tax=Amnibacterium sp. TaxID=1872496 RepID=UPI003F7B513C